MESSSTPDDAVITDSVILHYFLLSGHAQLLIDLLARPLRTSRIVYDPDQEPSVPPGAMSEMSRAIDWHQRRVIDRSLSIARRTEAEIAAERLAVIHTLYQQGDLVAVDMSELEQALYAELTNPHHCATYQLALPLDPGEAACVAIAVERHWTLATDDTDALKGLEVASPGHAYERIRKLLIRAANKGRLTREAANVIHDEMTSYGFWDRQRPFPGLRN